MASLSSAMSICSAGPASTDMSDEGADDGCPICYRLLYEPYTTRPCQHTFCYSCLITSAYISTLLPPPMTVKPIPERLTLSANMMISCPLCRTKCRASANSSRAQALKDANPETYGAQDVSGLPQNMVMCIGNTVDRHLADEDNPYSHVMDIARPTRWTFFTISTHPEAIDSVDLVLDYPVTQHRLATMRTAPFQMRYACEQPFNLEIHITLKAGYVWTDHQRAFDSSGRLEGGVPRSLRKAARRRGRVRGKLDRLSIEQMLGFRDGGKQDTDVIEFYKVETEDDILPSLSRLFGEEEL